MNALNIDPSNSNSVSTLRLVCDLLLAGCFLAALTAATVDLFLCHWLAAVVATAATLLFGWAARGMLQHLDRWSANWEE